MAVLGSVLVGLAWTTSIAGALVAAPDVVVETTSDASGPIAKGDGVTFTLTVSNVGAAAAHHVTVTDRLPPGVQPIHLLPRMDGGSCSAVGSTEGGAAFTVVCVRPALDAGSSATVTIDTRIDADRPCGPIYNRATVSAHNEPVSAQANDSSAHVDHVACEPSIHFGGQGPRFARVGADVRSVFTVTNDGEVPLRDLAFRGTGCTVSASLSRGRLWPGHHWSLPCVRTIGSRDADHISITGRVTALTPNDARIRSVKAIKVHVIHPGLSVVVEGSARSGRPGDTMTYAFVVTNTGDSVVHGIRVVNDRLGLVGHVVALPPGKAVQLTSTETLRGAPTTFVDTTTVTGSDLSGSSVIARTTSTVAVLAVHRGSHRGGGTAFTGSDMAGAGTVAIALLGLGGIALWVGFRERKRPVGH